MKSAADPDPARRSHAPGAGTRRCPRGRSSRRRAQRRCMRDAVAELSAGRQGLGGRSCRGLTRGGRRRRAPRSWPRRRARTSAAEAAAGSAASGVRGRQEVVWRPRGRRAASMLVVDRREPGRVLGAVEAAAGRRRRPTGASAMSTRFGRRPRVGVADGDGVDDDAVLRRRCRRPWPGPCGCRCPSRRRAGSGRAPRPRAASKERMARPMASPSMVFCPAMPGCSVSSRLRAAAVSRVKGTRT